jgi:hypothetical protein
LTLAHGQKRAFSHAAPSAWLSLQRRRDFIIAGKFFRYRLKMRAVTPSCQGAEPGAGDGRQNGYAQVFVVEVSNRLEHAV